MILNVTEVHVFVPFKLSFFFKCFLFQNHITSFAFLLNYNQCICAPFLIAMVHKPSLEVSKV